jgi:hypothetical protein
MVLLGVGGKLELEAFDTVPNLLGASLLPFCQSNDHDVFTTVPAFL